MKTFTEFQDFQDAKSHFSPDSYTVDVITWGQMLFNICFSEYSLYRRKKSAQFYKI